MRDHQRFLYGKGTTKAAQRLALELTAYAGFRCSPDMALTMNGVTADVVAGLIYEGLVVSVPEMVKTAYDKVVDNGATRSGVMRHGRC
jgi:hypothetical protein